MAHEFKTPLTSIRAATTSLFSSPDQPAESRTELLQVADEEAHHLQELIDDAVEMARLDTAHIEVQPRARRPARTRAAKSSLRFQREIEDRPVEMSPLSIAAPVGARPAPGETGDQATVDNALKYSPPRDPGHIRVSKSGERRHTSKSPIMAREFRRTSRAVSSNDSIGARRSATKYRAPAWA